MTDAGSPMPAPVALDLQPLPISFAADTRYACHKWHVPRPELGHDHHVTVQAWQEHFVPPGHTPPPMPNRIWDKTTVFVPPSCHYAIHQRLMRLMRLFATLAGTADLADRTDAVVLAVAISRRPHGKGALAKIAERSPVHWLELGCSVRDLTNAKLWGQF